VVIIDALRLPNELEKQLFKTSVAELEQELELLWLYVGISHLVQEPVLDVGTA
jgi:hypothetical protein